MIGVVTLGAGADSQETAYRTINVRPTASEVAMFLITCPDTNVQRLADVHAIREHANTPHGVLTVIACECGGDVVLRQGEQVAHHARGASTLTPSAPREPMAA